MSITIIKEPTGIYPCYNDSFIEFNSDLADNYKAEITIHPTLIFTKVFVIYPDPDGNQFFNLKEAVKVIFNEAGFKDSNVFTTAYFKSISGLYLSQNIDIEVFNDSTSETTSETYEFYKAVKQIGKNISSNPFRLLAFSNDGINHSLTYYEGFPFSFDIQRILYILGKEIFVKSLNTGIVTSAMTVTETGAFRINVDKGGGDNWTSDNFLPLIEGLNRLEIYEDATFKTNLLLTKRKQCSGIYLKWHNDEGGFSNYLFNKFTIESIKSKDSGFVLNNEFENIYDLIRNSFSTGKEAEKELIVKATYNKSEYETLKYIFTSPLIQMYTSFTAYVEGKFIDVAIEGSMTNANKKNNNEIVLKIQLPKVITVKL